MRKAALTVVAIAFLMGVGTSAEARRGPHEAIFVRASTDAPNGKASNRYYFLPPYRYYSGPDAYYGGPLYRLRYSRD